VNIRKFFGHASDLAAIRALMMRYKVAIDQGDVETVLKCHVDHPDISAISLDSVYCGKAEVRAFFERLFSPSVREAQSRPSGESHICVQGDTALLVLQHEMRLLKPTPETLDCRISFTLVRINSEWRILHSHLSAPRSAFIEVGDSAH
jgi:ketosteroid isomerase-like protein